MEIAFAIPVDLKSPTPSLFKVDVALWCAPRDVCRGIEGASSWTVLVVLDVLLWTASLPFGCSNRALVFSAIPNMRQFPQYHGMSAYSSFIKWLYSSGLMSSHSMWFQVWQESHLMAGSASVTGCRHCGHTSSAFVVEKMLSDAGLDTISSVGMLLSIWSSKCPSFSRETSDKSAHTPSGLSMASVMGVAEVDEEETPANNENTIYKLVTSWLIGSFHIPIEVKRSNIWLTSSLG